MEYAELTLEWNGKRYWATGCAKGVCYRVRDGMLEACGRDGIWAKAIGDYLVPVTEPVPDHGVSLVGVWPPLKIGDQVTLANGSKGEVVRKGFDGNLIVEFHSGMETGELLTHTPTGLWAPAKDALRNRRHIVSRVPAVSESDDDRVRNLAAKVEQLQARLATAIETEPVECDEGPKLLEQIEPNSRVIFAGRAFRVIGHDPGYDDRIIMEYLDEDGQECLTWGEGGAQVERIITNPGGSPHKPATEFPTEPGVYLDENGSMWALRSCPHEYFPWLDVARASQGDSVWHKSPTATIVRRVKGIRP